MRAGIWVYKSVFQLVDAWAEQVEGRRVFNLRLDLAEDALTDGDNGSTPTLEQNRLIPTPTKLAVWKRDRGRCVQCGATDNLRFDHIISYSRRSSSLVAENIQLLCARHNLAKRDRE